MKFYKYHGIGNSFVIVDDRRGTVPKDPEWVRGVCDVNRGIGADGILYLQKPAGKANDLKMCIINSDGSEAEMCGNGIRCLAKYVHDMGISKKTHLRIETPAGIKSTTIERGSKKGISLVTVDMGRPRLNGERTESITLPNGVKVSFTPVSMGNPHAVIFEKGDVPRAKELGPLIECHKRFPQRTNVEFLDILSRSEANLIVFERGCGITQACGTGACASAYAGVIHGRFEPGSPITLHLLGGDLQITVSKDLGSIQMMGPAEYVFCGKMDGVRFKFE
jgi:diaminopimelate epimerase